MVFSLLWASPTAELVKNLPAMQETPVRFLIGKIHWRRERLPTPVFLCFPWDSAGKESTSNVRPGFDPWVGKIPWRRERLPTPIFWPGEFHGLYGPWGHRVRHDWETFASLRFSLLYNPTLIYIHDYWKNHSFDLMDLCQQSKVSAF